MASLAAAQAPLACSFALGEPVMLRSSDFDPDVLVWDSRQRAIDYAGGNVRSATELLSHTLLAKPGTRAIVVSCAPGTAKPKYTSDIFDTVGIKVTTGPQRGHYGWVTSDDVRGVHMAAAAASP
jgi:hypothetical protein